MCLHRPQPRLFECPCNMFVIKTRVGPSAIHGTGVFACEHVAVGDAVWRFDPPFDRVIPEDALANSLQRRSRTYRDVCVSLGRPRRAACPVRRSCEIPEPRCWIPTLKSGRSSRSPAARIKAGDEITCDYGAFCADWTGPESLEAPTSLAFGSHPSSPIATAASPPHRNLYTRIQSSSRWRWRIRDQRHSRRYRVVRWRRGTHRARDDGRL